MRGPTVTQIKVGALSQPPAASWETKKKTMCKQSVLHVEEPEQDWRQQAETPSKRRAKGQGTMHRPISSI